MDDRQQATLIQVLLFLAMVIPTIFFIFTQKRTLELIRPENRKIPTGQVWFQLIPLFGFIWQFYVIIKISDSIRDELNTPVDDSIFSEIAVQQHRPVFSAGILYATLFCIGFIPLPPLNVFFGLAGLITWIFYWVHLSRYKKQLKERYLLFNS
jgi:hypothetical protein